MWDFSGNVCEKTMLSDDLSLTCGYSFLLFIPRRNRNLLMQNTNFLRAILLQFQVILVKIFLIKKVA